MVVRAGHLYCDGLLVPELEGQRMRDYRFDWEFIAFFMRPLGRNAPLGSLGPPESDLP